MHGQQNIKICVSILHLHTCIGLPTDLLPADFSVTNSMELSPYFQANRCPTIRWIPRTLCNPKVHYLVHNLPPPPLSWARPVQSMHPISILEDSRSYYSPICFGSSKWCLSL